MFYGFQSVYPFHYWKLSGKAENAVEEAAKTLLPPMFKNNIGEIYILKQLSNSDASDLCEKQMLPKNYSLKGRNTFQLQAAEDPPMVMLGTNTGRDFIVTPFLLDNYCVLVLSWKKSKMALFFGKLNPSFSHSHVN